MQWVKEYTCRKVPYTNKNTKIKYLRTVTNEERKIVNPDIKLLEATTDVNLTNTFWVLRDSIYGGYKTMRSQPSKYNLSSEKTEMNNNYNKWTSRRKSTIGRQKDYYF